MQSKTPTTLPRAYRKICQAWEKRCTGPTMPCCCIFIIYMEWSSAGELNCDLITKVNVWSVRHKNFCVLELGSVVWWNEKLTTHSQWRNWKLKEFTTRQWSRAHIKINLELLQEKEKLRSGMAFTNSKICYWILNMLTTYGYFWRSIQQNEK